LESWNRKNRNPQHSGPRATAAQLRLEQAGRAKARDRVSNRHGLPPENPAGDREAQRYIAEMHPLHIHRITPLALPPEESRCRNLTNGLIDGQSTNVPWEWPKGVRGNQIGNITNLKQHCRSELRVPDSVESP